MNTVFVNGLWQLKNPSDAITYKKKIPIESNVVLGKGIEPIEKPIENNTIENNTLISNKKKPIFKKKQQKNIKFILTK